MKHIFIIFIAALFALAGVHATIIVDLDPGLARFDSLIHNDDAVTGFAAGDPGGQNANGLTFNVTFTPAAGDLDSLTQAVNVLEVGGDSNGSGLYLLGGELHFISKMDGGAGNVPTFNDLDWASGNNMIGVKSSVGVLSASEYSVAVVFDPLGTATVQLGVKPTGGSLTLDSFNLVNVGGKTNWSGDDSASAFRGGNITNFGGAHTAGGNPFQEAAINANVFEGTQGQALYWSLNGSVIPEPSSLSLLLLGLGGLSCLCRRR